MDASGEGGFHYNNGFFGSGDAELWYSMIRHLKPRMILEVGAGNSTHLTRGAIRTNAAEVTGYACRHLCIEP